MTVESEVSTILLKYGVHYKNDAATGEMMHAIQAERLTELKGILAELDAELWAYERPSGKSATGVLLRFKIAALSKEEAPKQ